MVPKKRSKGKLDSSIIKVVLIFFLVYGSLSYLYQRAHNTWFESLIIDTVTVKPSAFIINIINPDENVLPIEHRLVSSDVRLSVLNGCEGTEMLFLIIAAILAYRSSWKHKAHGLILGIMLVYLANQVRIVSLYFSLNYQREWFAALHGFIGPTIIIAIGCLFYLWWSKWPDQLRT